MYSDTAFLFVGPFVHWHNITSQWQTDVWTDWGVSGDSAPDSKFFFSPF